MPSGKAKVRFFTVMLGDGGLAAIVSFLALQRQQKIQWVGLEVRLRTFCCNEVNLCIQDDALNAGISAKGGIGVRLRNGFERCGMALRGSGVVKTFLV